MIIRPTNKFKGRRYPNGPHQGELIEMVVIKYPDYIHWLSQKTQVPGFQWLYEYINDCITLFDAKPFVKARCRGDVDKKKCTKPVTRFSLYPGSRTPYFWCDDCDPEQQGAVNTLTIGTQYYEALFHIWASCDRNRPNYRGVIKSLARAKGFAGNITEKNIIKFIHGPDSEVGV